MNKILIQQERRLIIAKNLLLNKTCSECHLRNKAPSFMSNKSWCVRSTLKAGKNTCEYFMEKV